MSDRTDRINLAHNENPYGPCPGVDTVFQHLHRSALCRYSPSFREKRPSPLAERLAELCGVAVERIALGYGAEGLLIDALHYFVKPNDRVFLPSGAWSRYGEIIADAGGKIVEYPVRRYTHDGIGRYAVDVDALLALNEEVPARVLLIASPANPTGDLFPRDQLDEVLAAFDVVAIDEAYFGTGDDAPDWKDLSQLVEAHPRLLIIRTFSKLFALAAKRMGYVIGGRDLDPFLRRITPYLGYDRVSELIGLAALDDLTYYEDVRRKMAGDRAILYQILSMFDDVTVFRSQANFVNVEIPVRVITELLSDLDAAGIDVKRLPDPRFGYSALRITIGTTRENRKLLQVMTHRLSRIPAGPNASMRVRADMLGPMKFATGRADVGPTKKGVLDGRGGRAREESAHRD